MGNLIFFSDFILFSFNSYFLNLHYQEDTINLGTTTDIPVELDYDVNYLVGKTCTETFKIHFKNLIDIPKVDLITKEKITFRSALRRGFIAAIFCALRYTYKLT